MPPKRKAAVPEASPASPQKKQVVSGDAPKSTRKRKQTGESKATPNKASKSADDDDEPEVEEPVAPIAEKNVTPKAPKSAKKSGQPGRRKSVSEAAAVAVGTPSTNEKPIKPVKSDQKIVKSAAKPVKKPSTPLPAPTISSATASPLTKPIPSHSKIVEVEVEDDEDDDEIISLWHQSWTAFNTCLKTIAPLFLSIVLLLYVYARINTSQAIASVALVYFFVCLLVLGTYFFAVAPFILVSNAINSFVNGGKTAQRDFVRVGVLLALIASVVAYFTHIRPQLS
jgi:hypothetical protein